MKKTYRLETYDPETDPLDDPFDVDIEYKVNRENGCKIHINIGDQKLIVIVSMIQFNRPAVSVQLTKPLDNVSFLE